ncbi:hypothetical protein NPIL_486401, partial [Nephila pilipes]
MSGQANRKKERRIKRNFSKRNGNSSINGVSFLKPENSNAATTTPTVDETPALSSKTNPPVDEKSALSSET